jgi:Carboxypeptidase regulatory-like domain
LFAVLALLIGGFTSEALGQVVNARIEGTITDSSGALLPGATVTVTNMDTNVRAFAGTTDGSGLYRALDVKPGRYSVRVTADGFAKQVQNNVNASEAQGITLNFQMQAGGVDQTVMVESSTQPTLDKSDATVATLITPSAIQDLPLNNRDITQTFLLVPGAAQGSNTNSQNNNQLSFNGSRTLGTNPLLDGTSVITASTGGIDTLPSPDALSEVKIITSITIRRLSLHPLHLLRQFQYHPSAAVTSHLANR